MKTYKSRKNIADATVTTIRDEIKLIMNVGFLTKAGLGLLGI